MSRFLTPLRIEDTGVAHNGRPIFRILESFDYEIGAEGSGLIIQVPIGFETDFASVPKFLWFVLPPWGIHGKAAVLHDFLYRRASGFGKDVADAIFYEAMTVLGVTWWRRYLMYLGVAYLGRSAYNWKEPMAAEAEVRMLDGERVKDEFRKSPKNGTA